METYIADEHGNIPVLGIQATYPPGTRIFYQNGEYAGHESPILEEVPPAEATAEIQSVAVAQVEPEEHPPVTQAEGEQYA